jgi:hypothetical protein
MRPESPPLERGNPAIREEPQGDEGSQQTSCRTGRYPLLVISLDYSKTASVFGRTARLIGRALS